MKIEINSRELEFLVDALEDAIDNWILDKEDLHLMKSLRERLQSDIEVSYEI